MSDEIHLVTELAIILIAAASFTIISKALKQPLILGYIIAGFLVGPHLGLFPQFSTSEIHEWSELGVIFLMFGLGLEFSFKKLMKIGSAAITMALTKCAGMFVVGLLVGLGMGWTMMESVFLGGMLGMSSTAIILKAYDDMGLKNRPYAPLVFGSLVFEDLIAVLLMVLLSTLAVTGKFNGVDMLHGILKLVFFLILWFLVGIYIIPTIFRRAKKFFTDEILLLVGIGLCFLMVVFANAVGFSSALGAFVMGSILAETLEGENINKVITPIKDLFAAIFFVSVGMMVDPAVIADHWLTILIISVVVVLGRLVFSTAGALMTGQGVDTAVNASFTLAQLGEFAFIIAGLGVSLHVLRDFIYPVIISVSVITAFTTPYMIKLGDPVARWVKKVLPAKVLKHIEPEHKLVIAGTRAEANQWKKLFRVYFIRIMIYLVLLIALELLCGTYLPDLLRPLLQQHIGRRATNVVIVLSTLLLMAPFIYGLTISGKTFNRMRDNLLKKNPDSRWMLHALVVLRAILSTAIVISVVATYLNPRWWVLLVLSLVVIVTFVIIARMTSDKEMMFEETFLRNYSQKEAEARRKAPVTTKVQEKLAGYDVHLRAITISPEFAFVGRSLREMPFRGKKSGANIIKIQRGKRSITIPSGDEVIYPGDKLLAVGTIPQLDNLESVIRDNQVDPSVFQEFDEYFTVEAVLVQKGSVLYDKTLRDTDMRASNCMVVSVVRDGKISTNPTAEFKFEDGDVVWIAGEKSSIEWYK